MLSGMNSTALLSLAAFLALSAALPASTGPIATSDKTAQPQESNSNKTEHLTKVAESPDISPFEVEDGVVPSLSDLEEVQEEDIPDDAPVWVVEEPLQDRPKGEIMDTASNVVFRPLFRYRERQTQRIANSNRRVRRRYYVPRRSYRDTSGYYSGYYRPYRSISRRHYQPYSRYYNYYPVLSS